MPQLIWVSNYEARNAVNVSIEKFDLLLAFSSSLLKYKIHTKRGRPASPNQISVSRKCAVNIDYWTHFIIKINVSTITQQHSELCKSITVFRQMVVLKPFFVWPPICSDYSALKKPLLNHYCHLS